MGRGKKWEDVNPSVGGTKYTDVIDMYQFTPDWSAIRLMGDLYEVANHWLHAKTKQGKDVNFPVLCRSNNGEPCPYCEAGIRKSTDYMSNSIIRELQDAEPIAKKKILPDSGAKFRKSGDKFWSPVRVIKFPSSVVLKIKNLQELNKVKKKDGTIIKPPFNHPVYGVDLLVSKDTAQQGSGMYDIQKDSRTPITDEEKDYLLYDLECIYNYVESYEEGVDKIKDLFQRGMFDNPKEFNVKSIAEFIGADYEDTEEEEEEENSKKKGKKAKKPVDEQDLEDDELEEEEKPKNKVKKDKKPVDDELEDDEDELEEEKPKKNGKKAKKTVDEDDELEDDDTEDEGEEKPKKNGKKAKKTVDEDDEDELEEEKPKKNGKKAKKTVDEDDELEDDDDLELDDDLLDDEDDEENNIELEDEDEEEEKPKKRGKKSKKPVDEDEDEEEEEEEEEKPKKSKSSKSTVTKKRTRR